MDKRFIPLVISIELACGIILLWLFIDLLSTL